MKKKKVLKLHGIIILLLVMIINIQSIPAQAQTLDYPNELIKLEVADNVLIMTPGTSSSDIVWYDAGVTDIKEQKKQMTDMGVIAAYYDPDTKSTVNLIAKNSEKTIELFTFAGMSSDEIKKYVQELVAEMENTKSEVSIIDHPQSTFFRLKLIFESEGTLISEVIYGTLINGRMIQYSTYKEGSEDINEELIQKLVSSTTITRVLTKQEYYDDMFRYRMITLAFVAGIAVIIVVFILLYKRKGRRTAEKMKMITEKMSSFRDRKKAGDINTSLPPKFISQTCYDDRLIEDYVTYNTWIKHGIQLGVSAIILVFLVINMISSSTVFAIVISIATLGMAYYTYNKSEKLKNMLKRQYETRQKKTALIRFYDEYFTITGLVSISEYIYAQITDISVYKDYIYLHISDQHAILLRKGSFAEGNEDEFISFIKANR